MVCGPKADTSCAPLTSCHSGINSCHMELCVQSSEDTLHLISPFLDTGPWGYDHGSASKGNHTSEEASAGLPD